MECRSIDAGQSCTIAVISSGHMQFRFLSPYSLHRETINSARLSNDNHLPLQFQSSSQNSIQPVQGLILKRAFSVANSSFPVKGFIRNLAPGSENSIWPELGLIRSCARSVANSLWFVYGFIFRFIISPPRILKIVSKVQVS